MIYLLLILNSILTYLLVYLYHKSKEIPLERKTGFKFVLLNNAVLLITMYIFYRLFPNNYFSDLFDPNHYAMIIGSNHRYIAEIGESVFSSEPPF